MMRTTILLMLVAFMAKAQPELYYSTKQFYDDYNRVKGVKFNLYFKTQMAGFHNEWQGEDVIIRELSVKGGSSEYKVLFDDQGDIEQAYTRGEKPEWQPYYKKVADSSGMVISSYTFSGKNREVSGRLVKEMDEDGNEVNLFYYNDKNKLRYHHHSSINALGLTDTVWMYSGKRHKLKSYYVHEYYPDSSKKATRVYKGNGKLKTSWSFACSEEGDQTNEIKTVCKEQEHTGEYRIETSIYPDYKNREIKSVRKYTVSDSTLVEHKKSREGVLTYHFKREGESTTRLSYNKRGKVYSRSYSRINKEGQILEEKHSYKGKVRTHRKYFYNEKGWIFKVESYDKNFELKSVAFFEFM